MNVAASMHTLYTPEFPHELQLVVVPTVAPTHLFLKTVISYSGLKFPFTGGVLSVGAAFVAAFFDLFSCLFLV